MYGMFLRVRCRNSGTTPRIASSNGNVEKWNGGRSSSTAFKVVIGLILDECLESTIVYCVLYIRQYLLRYSAGVDVTLKPILFKYNTDNIEIKLIPILLVTKRLVLMFSLVAWMLQMNYFTSFRSK